MFTGIVEELGSVRALEWLAADAARLLIRCDDVVTDAAAGDSIAVNGVCLTVVEHSADGFSADVMRETLERSSLGRLQPGDPVNLERAATLQTRLGGHLVQGHVDATAPVLDRRAAEHWEVLRVGLPAQLARYVVEKGSVCLDGTSLTVSALGPDWLEVSLIPTTLARTTLGVRQIGDLLNVEVDLVAKHLERLVEERVPR